MKVHLIGIGGSGLSAIARFLLESGFQVSGSDRQATPRAAALQQDGVRVFLGHHPDQVRGAEVVVRSSAVPDDNLEVLSARQLGIPVLKRAEFIGQLMAAHRRIAVAGSHGKTTTTAMLVWILTALGRDPSFIVGGVVEGLGTNAHAGQGEEFVIEADEYDRMFLGLQPEIAVVTNVEFDHPDYFSTPEDFFQAFVDFADRLTPDGTLVACIDDPGAARLLHEITPGGRRLISFGLDPTSLYRARDMQPAPSGGLGFELVRAGQPLAVVRLRVPGQHNVHNALAALAVADRLGLSVVEAAAALGGFKGTERRFQVHGQVGGVTVIDDYAHHPTEIRATLAAARMFYPQRALWAVWQPHTYSRTRAFYSDYLQAFSSADHVLVTEIYAARETDPGGLSAQDLVAAMRHPDAQFAPGLEAASRLLLNRVKAGEVVLVLSAGDADLISAQVLAGLEKRRQEHV